MAPFFITILIHGTVPLQPLALLLCASFFYCPDGLTPLRSPGDFRLSKTAHSLCLTDQERFQKEHFYLYGWSGRLSIKKRRGASARLYDEVIRLQKSYRERYGFVPPLRIITHSHGGNVALRLAEYAANDPHFIVDELVLLACPVQGVTSAHIKAACFKKIYSFYSRQDVIQIADPQGAYGFLEPQEYTKVTTPFFSERCFEPIDTLWQVGIEFRRKNLMHIDFLRYHFIAVLPELLRWIAMVEESVPLCGRHRCIEISVNTRLPRRSRRRKQTKKQQHYIEIVRPKKLALILESLS